MRTTISAFTTVIIAALLSVVTVFVPTLPVLTGPLVMSLVVVLFSIAWPFLVSPNPRWDVSTALSVTGLAAVWVVALLPADTRFSSFNTELWLAPIGGAAALGVLLIFGIQTFRLPGGVNRVLSTAIFAVGAVLAATTAGWTLLLRHKYEVAQGALEVERISGVTWLMLTVQITMAVAALVTLLPSRRRNRMIAVIVTAVIIAVGLQLLRPGVLSVPAVLASAVVALIIGLANSFANTTETSAAALRHPLTAVAVGTGTPVVAGMISYFVIHVLPW